MGTCFQRRRHQGKSLQRLLYFGIQACRKGNTRHQDQWIGSYSETFDFELTDCELSATSDTWRFIPGVTDEAKYNLGEFKIKKFSRYANHIVFLLDRWTIEERIIKNDSVIGELLSGFTVAQLLDFISLASEKNSTNSLAVLMEYKNSKFDQYDPLMNFTLD